MREACVDMPTMLLLAALALPAWQAAAADPSSASAAPGPTLSSTPTQPPAPSLGQPIDAAELAQLSITVFPDGCGLPPGGGSVQGGARLYATLCAACHGARGIEGPAARLSGSDGWFAWNDPLRALRIRRDPLLVLSVGAMWPYATSIFDYVRRAMPHQDPKSLRDDEVYALTAYLLHQQGLLPQDGTVDQDSLPGIVMPGRARGVSAWPPRIAGPSSRPRD